MNHNLAETAALFSDPGRASILTALLGGIALPAGQLAMVASVSPQTTSSHLSKLVSGRLLKVEQQGRHRYYRLADAEVAHAVEALLAITPKPRTASRPTVHKEISQVGTLSYARTCYSHLAGLVGVKVNEAMQQRGLLVYQQPKFYRLSESGRTWLAALDIRISETQMQKKEPRFARPCLDWTERRYHLAGQLGTLLLVRFRELKWIAPVRGSRAVRVTLEGQSKLHKLLGVRLPAS